jgi:malonyl-CoA O-methyltransferase
MNETPSNNAVNAGSVRPLDLGRVVLALHRLAQGAQVPWLHQEVARRMAERLSLIRAQPTQLLDWWGLAGGGQVVLAHAYPKAQRLCVEPTPELRQCAAQPTTGLRKFWKSNTTKVMAPNDVQPNSVQLVWANMMLHAVADPTRTLAAWHQALQVDGFVMFSCLGPGTLRELRELYQRLGWPTPTADFIDMHDLGDMLVQSGFADPVMDQETLHLSWPSAQALLLELRGLGGNAAPNRFQGLRTPRWHQQLLRELGGLQSNDGRIHMRFEVAYGHAFKVPPRPTLAAQTMVSLDEMRVLLKK